MSLIVCQWGGNINASNSLPSPVEIWSNTLALISTEPSPDNAYLEGLNVLLRSPLESWFVNAHTYIDATVSLEYLKTNAYNVLTGHQTTDPSVEHLWTTPDRGYVVGDYSPPTSQSYRISLDDGTRHRTSRGGFFVPRAAAAVEHSGRWISGMPALAVGNAQTFLNAVNTIDGITVGVWSRKDHSVTAVTRARVGDRPDNISTRANALHEAYAAAAIS